MKKILLFLLLPLFSQAQINFAGATGTIIRNPEFATFTNASSTEQILFSSTVRANTMTVGRPYAFTCDMSLVSPAVSLATITFNVRLGAKVLTFVSASGITANLTGTASGITITGYLVMRANGDILAKYTVSPTGTISVLALTTTNTVQFATFTGVDITSDQAFSVNVVFGTSFLSTTTLTRQYYARSEF